MGEPGNVCALLQRRGRLGVHYWGVLRLAGALFNPSRSHIQSQVVVILPEDSKMFYFEMEINNRHKVVCFFERARRGQGRK